MRVCVCEREMVCVCVCVSVCESMRMCVCVFVYEGLCVCVYIYIWYMNMLCQGGHFCVCVCVRACACVRAIRKRRLFQRPRASILCPYVSDVPVLNRARVHPYLPSTVHTRLVPQVCVLTGGRTWPKLSSSWCVQRRRVCLALRAELSVSQWWRSSLQRCTMSARA